MLYTHSCAESCSSKAIQDPEIPIPIRKTSPKANATLMKRPFSTLRRAKKSQKDRRKSSCPSQVGRRHFSQVVWAKKKFGRVQAFIKLLWVKLPFVLPGYAKTTLTCPWRIATARRHQLHTTASPRPAGTRFAVQTASRPRPQEHAYAPADAQN